MFKKNLIKILYGYRNLYNDGLLDKISKNQQDISKIKLIKNTFLNKFFFPKTRIDRNIVFNNFFLSKIGIYNLRYHLIKYYYKKNSNIIAPIPNEWLHYLKRENFKINFFLSNVLFQITTLKYFFFGIFIYLKVTLELLKNLFNQDMENYNFFNNISKNNIPSLEESDEVKKNNNYCLFNFYKKNFSTNKNRLILYSSRDPGLNKKYPTNINDNTLQKSNFPIFPYLKINYFFLFLFDGFFKIILAFISMLIGNYWNTFLLSEQPLLFLSKFKNSTNLPNDIIFTLSDLYFRPLWTYELEQKGSKIFMVWYSTNNQANYKKSLDEQFNNDWSNIIWPNHVVWNENQKNWLLKYLNNKNQNIIFYNFIWLNDKSIFIQPSSEEKYISIFPVTPYRRAYFSLFNEDEFEILRSKYQIKFIIDIFDISKKNNLKVFLKNKRLINKNHDKKYKNFINSLDKKIVKIIDEDVSPIKLLKMSKASINTPFTSTGYLANNIGLPTVYYDVTKKLKNFSFDKSIILLNDKKKLSNWVESII